MKKYIPYLAQAGITFVIAFFSLIIFFSAINLSKHKRLSYPSPPTLSLEKTSIDAKGQKISFPAFGISFRVPIDLETIKQIDPGSEDTQIDSNFIALYTPDSVIDPKKHVQTSGDRLSIHLVINKKDFTDEQNIMPATRIKEAVIINPENSAK